MLSSETFEAPVADDEVDQLRSLFTHAHEHPQNPLKKMLNLFSGKSAPEPNSARDHEKGAAAQLEPRPG